MAETDGIVDSTSENFNVLTVAAGTINHQPVFDVALTDMTIGLGATGKYNIFFSDLNAGDSHTLTILPVIPAMGAILCDPASC